MSMKYLVLSVVLLSLTFVTYRVFTSEKFNKTTKSQGDVYSENGCVMPPIISPTTPFVLPSQDEEITMVEPEKEPEIIEAKTMDEAIAKSKKYNKDIFVFFHATWCHNCEAMQKYFGEKNVKAEMSKYIVLYSDVDVDTKLKRRYHIRLLPTYLIVDNKENIMKSGWGYIPADQFINWLKLNKRPAGTASVVTDLY